MSSVNMAESNSKNGILALAHKRISRTKTKVLQNLGKAEKTTDDVFTENVSKIEKQQEAAHSLQKELKSYVHCLREMSQASRSLTSVLTEIYEQDWTKESSFKAQLQAVDLLWNDLVTNVQDSVLVSLNSYLQAFPVLKSKVSKRGRKMVDYDNCRHHLDGLLSSKKRDESKIHKAREDLGEAKRVFDDLNNELHNELPEFNNSRITFYASLLTNLFGAEHVFHSEVGKVNDNLENICQELGKDFQQFAYKPKRAVSKSISSNSGENGFNEDASSLPSSRQTRTSIGSTGSSPNKEISQNACSQQQSEIKQTNQRSNSFESPPHTSPLSQDRNSAQDIRRHQARDGLSSGQDNKRPTTSDSPTNHQRNQGSSFREPRSNGINVYDDPRDSEISISNTQPLTNSESDEEEPMYNNGPIHWPLKSPPPHTLFVVKALHKYTSEDVDELSFEPGEIIYVVEYENPEEQDEGWQMGIKASDGVKGVFPENFTQRMATIQS